jgi:hypothetical protein
LAKRLGFTDVPEDAGGEGDLQPGGGAHDPAGVRLTVERAHALLGDGDLDLLVEAARQPGLRGEVLGQRGELQRPAA